MFKNYKKKFKVKYKRPCKTTTRQNNLTAREFKIPKITHR